MMSFEEEIKSIVNSENSDASTSKRFIERLMDAGYARDENPASHYCIYFLPYNPKTKEVFLVSHKKSGLWIFPGGHIDKGEDLMQTLNREIHEELGVKDRITGNIQPFLLTITPMNDPKRSCKEHLDIWYRFESDGNEFNVGTEEFNETRWLTIGEARKLVTDVPNLKALDKIEKIFGGSSM